MKYSLIILVDNKKGGLMAQTLLKAHPPIVVRYPHDNEWYRDGFSWDYLYEAKVEEIGLPLWFSGELVPEGWFRLRQLLSKHSFRTSENPSSEEVILAGMKASELGIGGRLIWRET